VYLFYNSWPASKELADKKDNTSLRKSSDSPVGICYLLSVLRIRSPDGQHCRAHLTCGVELRERLEELNGLAERENGERRQQRGEPEPSPFNRLA
jgi:hypothetical protein